MRDHYSRYATLLKARDQEARIVQHAATQAGPDFGYAMHRALQKAKRINSHIRDLVNKYPELPSW